MVGGIRKMKKILLILLLLPTMLYADYTLTEEQRKQILEQLKKDKQTIVYYQGKLYKLRKVTPKITYTPKEDGTVDELIVIPVQDDNPLEYKSTFVVKPPLQDKWFPFSLLLCGTIETATLSDVKVGITLLSFKPLHIAILQNFNLNGLLGLKSVGGSLSYTLPKPFDNTCVHFYSGMAYTVKETFGIGVSLYF